MQAITGLTDTVEKITCEICGTSFIVEYIDDECRTIECPFCNALINVFWDTYI